MIYGEQTRRNLNWTQKGISGTIVYLCDWADVDPVYDTVNLPVIGGAWSAGRPYLRCVDISMQEMDGPSNPALELGGRCELTAQFSTERELAENFFDWNLSASTEQIDMTRGWTWAEYGAVVDQDIPTEISIGTLNITMRDLATPVAAIFGTQNQVNATEIVSTILDFTFPAGTLKYVGGNTEAAYNLDGTLSSCRTQHTFMYRAIPWNQMWRNPVQATDKDGIPLVWTNDAAMSTAPNYTVTETLVGRPYYLTFESASGGWDTPQYDGNPRYTEADILTPLGLVP